MEESVSQVVAC